MKEKKMKDSSTQNKSVSFKWTTTVFLAFCFLLYAQDSRSKDSQQGNSEINVEQVFDQKISAVKE